MSYDTCFTNINQSKKQKLSSSRFYVAALAAAASIQQVSALPQTIVQPSCSHNTRLLGDGDPHQNYWEVQVTSSLPCYDGTCSVGKTETDTVGWTVSAGINAGPYITGGFSVSESVSIGETTTCE